MVQVTVVISRTEYEELLAQNARLAQVLANWLKQIRLANKREPVPPGVEFGEGIKR